jgi:hypothetical protein
LNADEETANRLPKNDRERTTGRQNGKSNTSDHASTELCIKMRVLYFELNSVIGSLIQTTKFQTSKKNLN